MSNKRNCLKHILLISLIVLIFASCSPSSNGISETASLIVEAHQKGINVSSIAPTTPKIVKYVISLTQNSDTKSWEFEPTEIDGSSVQIDDIKVGTYDLYIAGYSVYEEGEDGLKTQVVEGSQSVTIKPNTTNIANITLSYLSTGTGTISLKIDWSGLTQTGNLISDALNRKSIGFLAFYADSDTNSSNDIAVCGNPTEETIKNKIKWAESEDFTNKFIEYTESGLNANKETEEIYFRIYSEIDGELVVIAETFRTNLTVYPNLVSIPDANDKYNFTLSDNNIMNYLRNVSSPVATAVDDKTLKITWINPEFSSNIYPITVTVTAKDIQTGSIAATGNVEYTSYSENGETTLKGLSSDKVYSIWFKIDGQIGYSADVGLISNARPRVPVTGIAFDPTENDFDYISGDTIEFKALITPDEATNKEYTISIENNAENVEITNHSVKFNKAGEYNIVLTSSDSGVKTDPKTAIVHLATPNKPTVSGASENGITITWNVIADADRYKIKRTANGTPDKEFITEDAETEFIDNNEISLGTTYTYTVIALMDEYESCSSAESENSDPVSTSAGSITINPAPALESGIDFSSSFDSINGISINNGNPSITINVTEISDATYEWKINGVFVTNNKDLTINGETNGISKNSSKTTNELTLIVTANGKTVSGSCSFYYESEDDFKIISLEDAYGDDMVVYDLEPEQLKLTYSRSDINPVVNWSTSAPSIVSVDQEGNISSVSKGSATITATVTNNGITRVATIDVESYIPVSEFKLAETPAHETLILSGNGIENIKDDYQYMTLKTITTPMNGTEYSGNITWENSAPSVADFDSKTGKVTPLTAGETTITATIDTGVNGIEPKTITQKVIVLGLEIKDGETTINGSNCSVNMAAHSGIPKSITLRILPEKFNNKAELDKLGITLKWCYNGEYNVTEPSGGVGYIRISNTNNNFTADITRVATRTEFKVTNVLRDKNGQDIVHAWFNCTN